MSAQTLVSVSLDSLSVRQRRLVERHMPLVHRTLSRLRELIRLHRGAGGYSELFQEGSLALIESVRTHDAARHGDFAPFAMARIHFAASRFSSENHSVIRVPYITQRRDRRRRCRNEKDRHRPYPAPRVIRLSHRHGVADRKQLDPSTVSTHRADTPTIGDEVRSRVEHASGRVLRRMARSPRVTPLGRRVLRKGHQERWSIPEPDGKTPIRELARTLDCPSSLVTRCEERFLEKIGRVLRDDAAMRTLLKWRRRRPDGMEHRLTKRERRHIADDLG